MKEMTLQFIGNTSPREKRTKGWILMGPSLNTIWKAQQAGLFKTETGHSSKEDRSIIEDIVTRNNLELA